MNKLASPLLSAAIILAPALITASTALAETVVKVTLWDKGETSMDNVDKHSLGIAMAGAEQGMATMGVTLDRQEVPSGEINFKITNDSGEFFHALLISPVADPPAPLPYLSNEERVDEVATTISANLGEVRPHDFKAGKATLTPGNYILYCNIAGHYTMGMWTLLTVTD